MPLPDTGPSGPHVAVVAEGQVVIEFGVSGRKVMPVGPGTLVPEGLVAGHGARLRAPNQAVVFRIRRTDLLAVVNSIASAQEWYYPFRLLERRARDVLSSRLGSAGGAGKVLEEHPVDAEIQAWSFRRKEAMELASNARKQRQELRDFEEPFLLDRSPPGRRRSRPSSATSGRLSAYPAMRVELARQRSAGRTRLSASKGRNPGLCPPGTCPPQLSFSEGLGACAEA